MRELARTLMIRTLKDAIARPRNEADNAIPWSRQQETLH